VKASAATALVEWVGVARAAAIALRAHKGCCCAVVAAVSACIGALESLTRALSLCQSAAVRSLVSIVVKTAAATAVRAGRAGITRTAPPPLLLLRMQVQCGGGQL